MQSRLGLSALLLIALPFAAGACSSSPSGAPSTQASKTDVGHVMKMKLHKPTMQIAAREPWVRAAQSAAKNAPVVEAESARAEKLFPRYPAFTPDAPQIVQNGGPVLKNPRVVTITWDGDNGRDTFDAFGDMIGDSEYWESVREWGVGRASSGAANHVHVSGAFGPFTDQTIEDWIVQQVTSSATSGWPAYTDQTIYTVYVPPGGNLTLGGAPACQVAGGYHANTIPATSTSPSIVYAIVFGCWGTDYSTNIASHEIVEAATDPLPFTNLGNVTFDPNHLAYEFFQSFQDEVGDACEFFAASTEEEPPPFTFMVQRPWSNVAASRGHNPCIPRDYNESYYNTTTFPEQLEDITIDLTALGLGPTTTKGIKVALGESKTFEIGFYSDGPTDPWTVSAVVAPKLPVTDMNGNAIDNGDIDVTIDHATGSNGHKARVTVTPRRASASIGGEYIEIHSGFASFGEAHTLPILISQK